MTTQLHEISLFENMTNLMDVLSLDDFCDIDGFGQHGDDDDLETDRFVFLDNSAYTDLVETKFSLKTLSKLKYIQALFLEWRTKRNGTVVDGLVPEKGKKCA